MNRFFRKIKRRTKRKMLLATAGSLFLILVIGIILAFAGDSEQVSNPIDNEKDTKKSNTSEQRLTTGTNDETTVAYTKGVYHIRVNKTMNVVTIYGLDDNNEFTVPVKEMLCSTGKDTPLGNFAISEKQEWLLLEGDVWGQYACRIFESFLFHSVPYDEKRKDSLKPDYYNKLGTQASAGCIRLAVEDCKWIYDNCEEGTTVEIYEGQEILPFPTPTSIKVPDYTGWDPTDPDQNNPWLKAKVGTIAVCDSVTLERGSKVNYLANVVALDKNGKDVTESLKYTDVVDTDVPGTYTVVYSYSDYAEMKGTITYTVEDNTPPDINGLQLLDLIKYRSQLNSADTRNEILSNLQQSVSLTDYGDYLDPSKVQIVLPDELVEGQNQYYYEATDYYGNKSRLYGTLNITLLEDETIPIQPSTTVTATTGISNSTTTDSNKDETITKSNGKQATTVPTNSFETTTTAQTGTYGGR